MIGIIVADPNEINKFEFEKIKTEKINQFEFNIYKINGKEVVVVHSGIGIANAAAATQELISSYNVESIYNYGAVGGDDTVEVFDLIAPERIYFHDVVTPWYKRGQTPNEKEYFVNSLSLENKNNLGSGSSFLSSKELIDTVKKDIDVNIFDMETAAIAQIADKNNVKLYVIKCVSDSIGKTDDSLGNINERIQKAGLIAFKKTIELIKK